MPEIEVDLSDRLLNELERAAEEEFLNREEAVEEFLRLGIGAYDIEEEDPEPGMGEDRWDTQDPMGGVGPGVDEDEPDEHTF
jgi:hypothetical protein